MLRTSDLISSLLSLYFGYSRIRPINNLMNRRHITLDQATPTPLSLYIGYKIHACFLVIVRHLGSFLNQVKFSLIITRPSCPYTRDIPRKEKHTNYGSHKKTLKSLVRLQCSYNINPVSCTPNFSSNFGHHLFKMEPESHSWKAKLRKYIYQLFYNS